MWHEANNKLHMYVSIYKLISHRQSTSLSFKIDHMLRGITQSQLYKSDESFREKKQSLRVIHVSLRIHAFLFAPCISTTSFREWKTLKYYKIQLYRLPETLVETHFENNYLLREYYFARLETCSTSFRRGNNKDAKKRKKQQRSIVQETHDSHVTDDYKCNISGTSQTFTLVPFVSLHSFHEVG